MKSRKIHKTIGLVMVLPMIGWIVTGLIFFIKPGYQEAYDQVKIKTYPLERRFDIPYSADWTEVKLIRTVIGYHLLVKSPDGNSHLDPFTLAPKAFKNNEELVDLLNDAFTKNSERYGITDSFSVDSSPELQDKTTTTEPIKVITTTGVEVALNWTGLSLRQTGADTKLINTLYKIHYLQWTPSKTFNQYFGSFGLLLLLLLTFFGTKIYFQNRNRNSAATKYKGKNQ